MDTFFHFLLSSMSEFNNFVDEPMFWPFIVCGIVERFFIASNEI